MQRARAMAHSCPAPAPDHKRSGTQVVAMPSKDHGRQAGLPKSSTTAAAGIPAKGHAEDRKKDRLEKKQRGARQKQQAQKRQATQAKHEH